MVFCCKNFLRSFVFKIAGGVCVAQDLKAAKKPYSAPAFQILDAGTAKVELEAASAAQDANARQMLSVINQELERTASQAESAWDSPHPKSSSSGQ